MRLLPVILIILLSLPARAGELLDYTATLHFTWARIPLGALTLTMQEQGNGYRMRTEAETRGLARLFNRHRSTTEAQGVIRNDLCLPAAYRSDYVDNGEKRLIAVTYDKKGLPVEEIIDPPREENRPLVPQEMKAGSVDILTGFLEVRHRLRQALTNGGKTFYVMIYDGKRLFRVDASIESPRIMVAFHGIKRPAVKLLLHRVPLAGFKDKEIRKLKKRNPVVALYVDPERLVPFGLSLKVYGARLEAWIKPEEEKEETWRQLQPVKESG